MLASLIDVGHLVEVWGYPVMGLLVMAESGGVPLPGETALIVGGVLASQGKLQIEWVIAIAAFAAIVGDNIGYQIGRGGGRWLLQRPGHFHRQRLAVLEMGEPFFARHGTKAVFFGRFILGLRTWASWLAGATHMRWRTFFMWNALGGIVWATGVGLIAYFVGQSASNAIAAFGIYGLVAVVAVLGGVLVLHLRHRRHERTEEESRHRQTEAEESRRHSRTADTEEPLHPRRGAGTTDGSRS
jgi:membrane protein DedA with SNARE-associated domain